MLTDSENLPIVEENDQIAQRKLKLNALRQRSTAFPNDYKPTHLAAKLHQEYDITTTEDLAQQNIHVDVAGRIMTRRIMGKASFVHLQDRTDRLQIYIKQDELPEEVYQEFKDWDLGDIIGVSGVLFKTKTGELTIKAQHLRLLTKSLRPLPDKFHGLNDQELC